MMVRRGCDGVLPAGGNVRVSRPAHTLRCMGLQFNRLVSTELVAELRPEGRFDGLIGRRHELPWVADVQLRRAQGRECHASLYIGLTSVLNVRERGGRFALSAHKTHRAAGGFDPSCPRSGPQTIWPRTGPQWRDISISSSTEVSIRAGTGARACCMRCCVRGAPRHTGLSSVRRRRGPTARLLCETSSAPHPI